MRVDDYCRAVIASGKFTWHAQAVLWMIAAHVNRRDGTTFVSLQTIAELTGHHRRRVQAAVAELREAGVFHVDERAGRASVYRFPLHPSLSTPRRHTPGSNQQTPAPSAPSLAPGARDPGAQRTHNHVPNHVPNRGADDCGELPDWFVDKVGHRMNEATA
jgi:biotin operon repressor